MAKLYFFYGAMGAAKTSHLLTTEFNYRERGHKTLVLTSAVDTRARLNRVESRIGLGIDAVSIGKQEGIINRIRNLDPLPFAIFVDESQFLSETQIEDLAALVDDLDITVFCYGLRTDFQAKVFPGSKRLLELADTIEEVKTMCHCGRKAIMNARIQNDKIIKAGEQIQVGGSEMYVALCRRCWTKGYIK